MKKSTKTLWIYTAVLFSIAILLILVTTFTQSKIVDDDGDLSVLGTLTATSKQKINNLQNENLSLKAELDSLKVMHAEAVQNSENLIKSAQEEQALNEKVANLYQAYIDEDYTTMEKLMKELTKEQVDARIPTLYSDIKSILEE